MKDDRDIILKRLGDNDGVATTPPSPPAFNPPADLAAAFAESCRQNSADITFIDSEQQIPATVAAYLTRHQQPPTVACEASLADLPWQSADTRVADITARTADTNANNNDTHADDTCGITRVIAAAAHTGAMLITDDTALALSLLPPHHIAVVNRNDIVADIATLIAKLPKPLPRNCRLIAGPSRTADIEQTLTIGAHGPTAVFVIVINHA